MGLLSGSASVTRCKISSQPEEIDFDAAAFKEIPPSSSIRERIGFLPVEPGAEYQVGQHRWAFRLRIDRLRPDATAVREKLKELMRAERDATGESYISPRKRKALREVAEEEILLNTTPRSKVIECCIDRYHLWIGTTSNAYLGMVLLSLQSVGVSAFLQTPWLERGDENPPSEMIGIREDYQSILGCRFLRALMNDEDLMVEAESGSARLVMPQARVNLSGAVTPELVRYVDLGAEILSAKLCGAGYQFRFDALNFRVSSLRMETESHDAWEDLLDERLEKIEELYELLDGKYTRWMKEA